MLVKYRDNIPREELHGFISSSSSKGAAAPASRCTAEGDEGLCVCPKCWQPLLPQMKKYHHSLNLLHFVCVDSWLMFFALRSSEEAGWVRKVTVEVWKRRHLGSRSSSSGSRARLRRRFPKRTARRSHQPKKVECVYVILISLQVWILDGYWCKMQINYFKLKITRPSQVASYSMMLASFDRVSFLAC